MHRCSDIEIMSAAGSGYNLAAPADYRLDPAREMPMASSFRALRESHLSRPENTGGIQVLAQPIV